MSARKIKDTQFKKGQIPWNKGTKGLIKENSGSFKTGHGIIGKGNKGKHWKLSDATKEKMRKAQLGEKNHRFGKIPWNKGKLMPESVGIALSKAQRGKCGKDSHAWKGGITPSNLLARAGEEFKIWREAVFKRDDWTCKKYGIKGCKLHAHHKKNFSKYPKLRFKVSNGITFSKEAHKEFHHIYGTKNNTSKQVREFLSKKYDT